MKIHYHSDHLGSASFVTNAEGAVVQHLQYLPYGELFVSQRNTEEFDSRYKFTAKELDNETSYTYFGARYYDIKLGETGGFLDRYDFDIKKGVEHIPRNIATWIGKQIAGQGTSYNIF